MADKPRGRSTIRQLVQTNHQRPSTTPFDVREGRAMVSLGPLSPKKYCTYSCAFCYVQADFLSYASMSTPEIMDWLTRQDAQSFDIVYVSGDTDSFAAPRAEHGLELLATLATLDKDVLFTTRAVFTGDELARLAAIASSLKQRGHLLFGCTSVAQFTVPHLEPKPVAPPQVRIQQLHEFKAHGLVSVLAMRPFLPNVPVTDYFSILELANGGIHVALGETWYADKKGVLEQAVFQGHPPTGVAYTEKPMPFDSNAAIWKVYETPETREAVAQRCSELGIPFFMRSRPAIEWARTHLR